jgi:glycerol-3-phosphate dehydrogenase (NAD(P)+)
MSGIERIGVVGAGAWGTALALAAIRAGRQVVLLARDAAEAAAIDAARETKRLPGIVLPSAIILTADPDRLRGCGAVLLVTPAQTIAEVLPRLVPCLAPDALVVLCAKGIERASGRFLSEIVAEHVGRARTAILSGPSFAADVGRGLPTAVTLAVPDAGRGAALAEALASASFRPYRSDDIIGVDIGGACKNVFAIAAGVVVGLGLGESARAAMIARGFAEMTRIGVALGAKPETFCGLSGLGDLVLTATSTQSRNLRFGLALGRGEAPETARAAIGTVEGAETASAAWALAQRLGVDAPIVGAVAAVVAGETTAAAAVDALLRRPLRAEV